MSQPKPAGQGPESTTGQTYSQIQKEIEERGRTHRNRFSGETPPTLPSGTVPANPTNVWNTVDREPEPPGEEE